MATPTQHRHKVAEAVAELRVDGGSLDRNSWAKVARAGPSIDLLESPSSGRLPPRCDKLAHLRLVVSGGAALSAALASTCEQRLGISVCQGYGLSEAAPVIAVAHSYGGPALVALAKAHTRAPSS